MDTAGLVGANPALAVDGGGRLHVLYDDFGDGSHSSIKYATCVAGCDAPGNWRVTVVTPGSGDKALAVDASGRLHVVYDEWPSPKYATCAIGCDAAANWQAVTVDDAVGAGGGYVALAVDANGRRHLSYWDFYNYDLKYATCAAGCVAAGSWQVVPLDTAELVGPFTGLAVDASGRLHISYHDWGEEDLKYATCAAGCDAADSWQATTVAGDGNVGFGSALAVDANGRTHVIYRDMTYRILKYMH